MKKNIVFFFLCVCFATSLNAQNTTDTFPSLFGKGKTYLYVVTMPGYFQVNHALEKIMEKEYTGEYEVIDMRDFATTSKKKNANIYVFEMIYDSQSGYFNGTGGRVGPQTDYSCGVTDLSTGKLYRLPYFKGNYKKVIEPYIKRLEQIRLTNEASK